MSKNHRSRETLTDPNTEGRGRRRGGGDRVWASSGEGCPLVGGFSHINSSKKYFGISLACSVRYNQSNIFPKTFILTRHVSIGENPKLIFQNKYFTLVKTEKGIYFYGTISMIYTLKLVRGPEVGNQSNKPCYT